MFLRPAHFRHPQFRAGIRDMLPVTPGFAAWGLMTGVAMVNSGMSVLEAVLMTVVVYAGSAQLAAIPLIMAGAPMWVILAAAFCVNLRFVVFSAHLRAYMMHLPRWERLLTGFLTTDLSYVLFVQRFPEPSEDPAQRLAQQAYLAGNCGLGWANWVLSGLAGVALANFIPSSWGLGFAGVLALLGISCSLITSRLRVLAAVAAGAVAVAAFAMPLKLNILLAIAAAVAMCLLLENRGLSRPATARAGESGDGE
ncbi:MULTISPECIES: AzlC family ABC transporter permease [Polaromonas]|uniref:AzlC family ABC transporter permease n=1 Tax=Polaromonas aquatica TaxID=332657 RepID=A0ABW1TVG8_9BURK